MQTRVTDDTKLTAERLRDAVLSVAPGDAVEYHVGFLTRDREPDDAGNGRWKRVDEIAKEAMALNKANIVHLLQRKLQHGVYSYLAVRRSVSLSTHVRPLQDAAA